jgi:hypothetical protein
MLKAIMDDIVQRSGSESWVATDEIWYRLNIMRNGYGFTRLIPQQSAEHAHGLSQAQANGMIKRGDTLHEINVQIKRIK